MKLKSEHILFVRLVVKIFVLFYTYYLEYLCVLCQLNRLNLAFWPNELWRANAKRVMLICDKLWTLLSLTFTTVHAFTIVLNI
jgi:hypothetical protein